MRYSNNDFRNTYQSATQKLLRRENAYRTNVTTPPYKPTLILNLINILARHGLTKGLDTAVVQF
jgi:hypothetical protein